MSNMRIKINYNIYWSHDAGIDLWGDFMFDVWGKRMEKKIIREEGELKEENTDEKIEKDNEWDIRFIK